MKKILIATGGTAGHIYPALVTAEQLAASGWRAVFIGALGRAGDRVRQAGFEVILIRAKGFVARGLRARVSALFLAAEAFLVSLGVMLRSRPDAVLGFGGYSSFPVVVAAWVLGVPVIVHEQNVVPGLANRVLGRLARRVALTFRESLRFFPRDKAVRVGCPLRPLDAKRGRSEILKSFALEEGRKTLLIFGGSQGSRTVNQAVLAVLQGLPSDTPWQVIHMTGEADVEEVRQGYARLSFPFFAAEYIPDIIEAYAVADLVIARAGAGTVTELGVLGIPAVLIPYPYAGNHQIANARVLERCGTGVIIEEKSLKVPVLRDKIFALFEERSSREKNRERLKDDFTSRAAERLIQEIEQLVNG